MNNNDEKQPAMETGKQEPQNISGKNESQAKERTEPLKEDEATRHDQEEGSMDHGELGAGLGK
jgi:hypothetical protein